MTMAVNKGRNVFSVRRIAALAVLTAVSMVLSLVETYIPVPIPVPGVKIGLANIVTLVLITNFDIMSALTVLIARCILSAVFSGSINAIFFSLAGGISSCAVMWLFYRKIHLDFSLIGISVIGAAAHNTAQIMTAIVLMKDGAILYYLPVLLLCGLVTGFAIGVCGTRASIAISEMTRWVQ